MPKKKTGRRISGNPAKAAEQLQFERDMQELRTAPIEEGRPSTSQDWADLERDLRVKYPQCPECGGPMEASDGEEGVDDEGRTVISMWLWCANDEDSADPKPHPITGGSVELERVLV